MANTCIEPVESQVDAPVKYLNPNAILITFGDDRHRSDNPNLAVMGWMYTPFGWNDIKKF